MQFATNRCRLKGSAPVLGPSARRVMGLVLGFATPYMAYHMCAFGAANANRLTYLDETEPFYPSLQFPKLVAPQWSGETGVEGVVILAIDDMKAPEAYQAFLRPIVARLKEID